MAFYFTKKNKFNKSIFILFAKLYEACRASNKWKEFRNMGRHKVDRSNKIMQTFEATKPLKERLVALAKKKDVTVSALIREILEKYFEERN